MLGIIFGTLCLIGLIKVLSGGWHYRRFGYYGHHGRYGRRGGPGRWMMRRMFERLETAPGQEKVVLQAVHEVRNAAQKLWQDRREAQAAVAAAFRAPQLDAEKVNQVFAAFEAKLQELKKTAVQGLAQVHDALDERQRVELAALVESAGGWS